MFIQKLEVLQNQTGKKFQEIMEGLEKLESLKQDKLLTTDAIHISKGGIVLDGKPVEFTKTGFQSFTSTFGMPATYAERCIQHDKEHGTTMFLSHMDEWVKNYAQGKELLFRTYDTKNGKSRLRAVLSSRYGILDNMELVSDLDSMIKEYPLAITNSNVTSDYLNLRIAYNSPLKIGTVRGESDVVVPALHLRNSEVGLSRVTVSIVIYRQVCSNGMMVAGRDFQAIGKKHFGDMEINLVPALLDSMTELPSIMDKYGDAMVNAKADVYDTPMENVFSDIFDKYTVNKSRREAILNHFQEEEGTSRHHVIQAITAAGRDMGDWNSRLEMEKLGTTVLLHA